MRAAGSRGAGSAGAGDSIPIAFSPKDLLLFDIQIGGRLDIKGRGMRPLVRRGCDILLSIPMKGAVNSLNASVAGGIILYEVLRQRVQTPLCTKV